MKKILMVLLLVFIAIFLFNCKTDPVSGDSGDAGDAGDVGTYEVLGAYLKIESTGMYFNELLNNTSSETVTLETIVNLRDEPTSDRRTMNQGFFGSGGGITFSTANGLNPQGVGCDGTAHVNGFISKGPFNEGSAVTITLIDENLNEIPIDTEFLSQLDGETTTASTFSIDLSATEDIDIPINVNLLTALQSARVNSLAENGVSYADAYEQAKGEVLSVFNLESETGNIEEFESINLTDNTNGGAALLVASSVVLNDNTGGRSVTDFIDSIKNDVAENGALTDETLADTLSENIQNTDFTAIVNNLQTYYDNIGETVDVPETNDFEDNDGDNVPNLYDIDLTAPMGFADDTLPTLQWEYNGGLTGHEYIVQVSVNDAFIPSQTTEYLATSTSLTLTDALNPNQTYYWRVSVSYNNVPLYWPASTSFITSSSTDLPYGGFVIEGGIASTPTRIVTLDNSGVIGATEMRFSNDGTFDPNDQDWTSFELTKSWILTEGLGEKTVYAQFRNANGTSPMSQSITYDNQSYPTGSFVINNDALETSNTDVTLDLSEISGAFKMRFSNDGTFDTAEEAWVDFSSEYNWTLTDGAGEKTVTGEFKNSQGTNLNNPAPNNEPITDTITLVDVTTIPTGTFSVEESNITSSNITVTLDNSGILGADTMYFSDDGTSPTDTDYYPYSSNYVFTLSTMDTSHTIAGYFKNTHGDYNTDANVSYYSLTVSVNESSYGSVIVQPDTPLYESGSVVSLTPVPESGYAFVEWTGTDIPTDADGNGVFTLTMDADKSTTANFDVFSEYNVMFETTAGGTVTMPGLGSYPIPSEGGVLEAEIGATPETGYIFDSWTIESGTGISFSNELEPYTYAIIDTGALTGNVTLRANFVTSATQYTLSSFATLGGSISITPTGGPNYNSDTNVTLEAIPEPGYQFDGWSGDASGTTNPLTITMDGNKHIEANFIEETQYTLTTYVASGLGSISLNPTGGLYNNGTNVTLEAIPELGYQFDGWSGDASGTTNPLTITMDNNKYIEANFIEDTAPTDTNLALGMTATASSIESATYPPEYAVDGNFSTRWASGSAFTPSEWIYVDLGNTYEVKTINLNWEASANTYRILACPNGSDPSIIPGDWTQIGGDRTGSGNSSTDVINDIFPARYVKMEADGTMGTNGVSLWEFEIFGSLPPIAHYPFNGDTLDATPNAYDGTINGSVTLTNDMHGNIDSAYLFDGTTGYIETTLTSDIEFTGDFTISLWVKPDITDGSLHAIIEKDSYSTSGNHPESSEFQLELSNSNNFRFMIGEGSGSWAFSQLSSSTQATAGLWYHVTIRMYGSTMSIFVNGISEGTLTHSATRISGTNPVRIGYTDDGEFGSPTYFDGAIDNVRIYNVALSDSVIYSIYNRESTP